MMCSNWQGGYYLAETVKATTCITKTALAATAWLFRRASATSSTLSYLLLKISGRRCQRTCWDHRKIGTNEVRFTVWALGRDTKIDQILVFNATLLYGK